MTSTIVSVNINFNPPEPKNAVFSYGRRLKK